MLRSGKTKLLALVLALVVMASMTVIADPGDKEKLLEDISGSSIKGYIEALVPEVGDRIAGTPAEDEAAWYIRDQFVEYGLEGVGTPSFDTVVFYDEGSHFTVNAPTELAGEYDSQNMEFTAAGDVTGELVYAGLGGAADFADGKAYGKIALIQRGEYYFSEKVENAFNGGAIGAILFNNVVETGGFINGTLGAESKIPAIEIQKDDGDMLAAELQKGTKITVTLTAEGRVEPVKSHNVVGTLYAEGSSKNTPTIVIGAHYDSVDTPGANDNASGAAAVLELARVLSGYELDANITFAAFGAEEVGLVGSYEYVQSLEKLEKKNIAAMINMDMIGVGDRVGTYTAGDRKSGVLLKMAENYVDKYGLEEYADEKVSDRSDHASFAEAGIPAVYFSYEADTNYHTDEDKIEYISEDNLENIAKIVAEMTYDMAEAPRLQSTQGFNGTVNQYRHANPNKELK